MEIREPKISDLNSILETLTKSITMTFLNEGLARLDKDIINEIIKKYSNVYDFVHKRSKSYFFLVALEKRSSWYNLLWSSKRCDYK